MSKENYSAKDILEIRGAFMYFMGVLLVGIVASTFQIIAKVHIRGIIPPLILNITCMILAFII